MRTAYLQCSAGISGDMFLGALVGAGVPPRVLEEAAAALGLHASLRIHTADRSGISACKVDVLEGGRPAESPAPGRDSDPAHQHRHGRSLTAIRRILAATDLPENVKLRAIAVFERLGRAEADVHNVPVEQIHFHEVGAVDAMVDIVAASAGIEYLASAGPLRWHCSPVNVGGGVVHCAHGLFPVPAPAVVELLRGVPTYGAHVERELVTPTGAALLRSLDPVFGSQPAMRVRSVGYGAGSANPPGFPNVLRLLLGEGSDDLSPRAGEEIAVLESALDDATPQLLAYVGERLLAEGALDVMLSSVVMKKGRLGTLLTALAEPSRREALAELLLRETTTLGVRTRSETRFALVRRHVTVTTPYGEVRVKLGVAAGAGPGSADHPAADHPVGGPPGEDRTGAAEPGMIRNVQPEYEDCRRCAAQAGVPLKEVQQAAIAAYHAQLLPDPSAPAGPASGSAS